MSTQEASTAGLAAQYKSPDKAHYKLFGYLCALFINFASISTLMIEALQGLAIGVVGLDGAAWGSRF